MKLAFITPIKWINQFGNQGDFHLALSHLLDRFKANEYEKELLKSKIPIILDNGLFENGNPEGIDSLINKAIRIKVKIFFAPDYLYNAEQTKNSVKITKDILKKRQVNNLMLGVVVQADTKEDWIKQYIEFCNDSDIALIGLSILSIPRCFGSWNKRKHEKKEKYQLDLNEITSSRIECLKELQKLDIKHKACHLLGLGNSYKDVIYAKENCPFVFSNDTSSCFQNGLFMRKIEGDNLEVRGGKVEEKVDFNLQEISKAQEKIIQNNINQVKKIICK